MPSSELERVIVRNANFLVVRRAGSGDGQAGLHDSVTGKFIAGIGGGWLPEYSFYAKPDNTHLIRGWRNILYELLARPRVRPTREIRKLLGEQEAYDARDYGMVHAPMANPAPAWNHSGLRSDA